MFVMVFSLDFLSLISTSGIRSREKESTAGPTDCRKERVDGSFFPANFMTSTPHRHFLCKREDGATWQCAEEEEISTTGRICM